MSEPGFCRSLVALAACDSLDELLDEATLLLTQLGARGCVELWDGDSGRFTRGERPDEASSKLTWIGTRYTIGAVIVVAGDAEPANVDLLALQLAPLAERLIEREALQAGSIRRGIARLYESRIRDALIRLDWNASAVARELRVSRGRIAHVVRKMTAAL